MRLKRHREDVNDLRLQQDAHIQSVAKRYLNLIRAAEEAMEELEKKHPALEAWTLTPKIQRVLKDADA